MLMHLIAPSGATIDSRRPVSGIKWLNQQGVDVRNTECILRMHERFSGSDEERLKELNQLPSLPRESIAMATRGGYGLHRILKDIEWNAISSAINNGLQICGHSDFTAFHLALLARTNSISLAGPMLNFDFGNVDDAGEMISPSEFMWINFQDAVKKRALDCSVSCQQDFLGMKGSSHSATGMLWGGNLTVLTSLMSTAYFPSHSQYQGGILFLEDVNEHPYRIERMLMQLLEAGILGSQNAILLGNFSGFRLYENDNGYNLLSAFEAIRKRLPDDLPILTGLPFGHCLDKITIPVGANATLQCNENGFLLKAGW